MKCFKNIIILVIMLLTTLFVNLSSLEATSLWKGKGDSLNSSLFTDLKAREVNDILTIIISESSSAVRSATTTTGRDTTVDGKITDWFGLSKITKPLKALVGKEDIKTKKHDTNNLPKWGIEVSHEFEGTGSTARKDTLVAKITCKVTEVLPNGNLLIEGKQVVTVNNEEQCIILTGIVRPADITPENTVYSYNVADARIIYTGKGPLGDKQKRGVFEWLLDFLWPF